MDHAMPEDAPLEPRSVYAATKVQRSGHRVAARWPLVRRPLADRCRRLARRVTRVLAGVVVVRLAVELVGVPLVAAVLGLVLVVAGLWWWARVVEPWLFAPRAPRARQSERPARTRPGDASAGMDHVAFARALAVVTDRYRMECERQAAAAGGSQRGGWS